MLRAIKNIILSYLNSPYINTTIFSKYSSNTEYISKEDAAKQTKAVESLLEDTINKYLPEYKDKVYTVGGFVRDKLLKKYPKDIDLVIDDPNKGLRSAEIFSKKLSDILNITTSNNPYPLKEDYGIWAIVIRHPKEKDKPYIYNGVDITGYTIELTPPRKEGPYDPNKRAPSYIKYTTLKEDANRRDLTINSLYQNVVTKEIIDYTGGIRDLKNKVLAPPDHPEGIEKIYEEDPLRIFRIIRFQNKLDGFKIDPKTENILKNFIKSPRGKRLIKDKISKERIREEFIKILTNPNTNKTIESIELLKEYDLLSFISEELDRIINKNWSRIKEALKSTPSNLKVRLSTLLHVTDNDTIEKILRELRFPNNIINSVKSIINAATIFKRGIQLSNVREFIEKAYEDLEEAIIFIKSIDKEHSIDVSRLEEKIREQKDKDLEKGFIKDKRYIYPLSGEQILSEIKITGPLLGAVKEKLKRILLEGHFDNLEEQERIEKAKKILKNLLSDEKMLSKKFMI